jgi:hypothetical protein
VDERRRAAAVQVDRIHRAEPEQDIGELRQAEPVVDARPAPVAGERDDVVVREAERRTGVTVRP